MRNTFSQSKFGRRNNISITFRWGMKGCTLSPGVGVQTVRTRDFSIFLSALPLVFNERSKINQATQPHPQWVSCKEMPHPGLGLYDSISQGDIGKGTPQSGRYRIALLGAPPLTYNTWPSDGPSSPYHYTQLSTGWLPVLYERMERLMQLMDKNTTVCVT